MQTGTNSEKGTESQGADAQKRLQKYGYKKAGSKPERLINETYVPQGPTDVRVRLRRMTLNVGSFASNKKLVECYLNDNCAHVAVITEAHIAQSKIANVAMGNCKVSNHCCRTEGGVKGGGGGGVITWIHNSVPFTEGRNYEVKRKDEMEPCSTVKYLNNNYEQKLVMAGVYRPPNHKHPSYEKALGRILLPHSKNQTAAIIAGDININTWQPEFHTWIEENELRELTVPQKPTFKVVTTEDAIMMAARNYLLEEMLPEEEELVRDQDLLEFFPVYVTEERVKNDHMALFLDKGTVRPDVINDKNKYNACSLTDKDSGKRDAAIRRDPQHSSLFTKLRRGIHDRDPGRRY